jgi:5-methylthioadenosine/S-adenosylhomocysteine deaminase
MESEIMNRILIKDSIIVTMDKKRRVIKDGAIVIENDRIIDVGLSDQVCKKHRGIDIVIDGKGKAILPGFINAHTHLYQVLLKSIPYDLAFPIWSSRFIYPIGMVLTEQDCYTSAFLGCIEMLSTGTTFCADNLYFHVSWNNVRGIAKAIEDSGIRANIALGFCDKGVPEPLKIPTSTALNQFEKFFREWHGKANGRIQVMIGMPGFGTCSDEALLRTKEFSKRNKLNYMIHSSGTIDNVNKAIADYGKRELEHFYDLRLLDESTSIIHSVWLSEKELELIKKSNSSIIHAPICNMFLAYGIAPIERMVSMGINVALGTDGLASYTQDMFQVLRAAGLLQKIHTLNAESLGAYKLLEMATINGAKALGLESEIGSIEVGKKADVIIVGLEKPHMYPLHNIIPLLAYSAIGLDVETVIVDGKIIIENKLFKTIDKDKVLENAQKVSESLIKRAGIKVENYY